MTRFIRASRIAQLAIHVELRDVVGVAPGTGIFSWRPTIAQADSTNVVTVKVTDNGSPSLTNAINFVVTVSPISAPNVSLVEVNNGQFTFQVNGDTGPDYFIEASTKSRRLEHGLLDEFPQFTVHLERFGLPAISGRLHRIRLGP